MTLSISFVLPTACPRCGGPVTYSGRGRRPTYCSTACKSDANAATRPERRAVPVSREAYDHERAEEARWDAAARGDGDALVRDWGGSMIPAQRSDRLRVRPASGPPTISRRLSDAPDVTSIPLDWRATVRPRATDPAAQWLAEHAPEALADFPEDEDLGSTSTVVPRPRRLPRKR